MKQAVLGLLLLATSLPAAGFELSGNRWREPRASFHIGMPGVSPGGEMWSAALRNALNQWSEKTLFQLTVVDSYEDPCTGRRNGGTGNRRAGADFTDDVCGTAFGNGVLAVTRTSGACFVPSCSTGFHIDDADLAFNRKENWEIYDGNRRSGRVDFGRVALHELGHALGLAHEKSRPSIMQEFVGDLHTLQADDINGIRAIYGGNEIVKPRDDVGTATLASVYGINVLLPTATRLAGPLDTLQLSGELETSDGRLDNRHIDIFQYTLARDSTANVLMTASSFNPLVYLVRVDSAQRPIATQYFTDDGSGGNQSARLVEVSLPAGTYWLGATSNGENQKGSYEITFSVVSKSQTLPPAVYRSPVYNLDVQINPNPRIEGQLAPGDGQLGNGSLIDLYEFSLPEAANLQIDLTSTRFDPYLYLAPRLADGQLDLARLLENDDGVPGGTNARITATLGAGTWWIGVSSFKAAATGDYEVTIKVIP